MNMRTCIIIDKSMENGFRYNACSIVMGQLARDNPNMYGNILLDKSGAQHASIKSNVVILQSNQGKLINFVEMLLKSRRKFVLFTKSGQNYSNEYNKYESCINSSDFQTLGVVCVGLYGIESDIKELTKKFSLAK